jgi:acetyl-CoA synthetase
MVFGINNVSSYVMSVMFFMMPYPTALTHMATYKLGAIAVPLFVLFKAEALEYRLRDSGAKVVVVEPSSLEVIREIQSIHIHYPGLLSLPVRSAASDYWMTAENLPNLKHIVVCPPMSALTTVANMPKGCSHRSLIHHWTTITIDWLM